ncbi:MAG TPA: hypothetical protein VK498_02830 [Ferruginibacter sp.]|nr:hypothetical protein [Ferruginibacter sp.]
MKEQDNNQEEKFSDNPEENLHIENELLKLKMQAESGAVFGNIVDLAPQIENEFLRHVQQFEEAWKDVEYVKVHDMVGKPGFMKADELSDNEVKEELDKLLKLLNEHNINLDMLGEYEPRIIYRFITEELFEHETDDLKLPGMTKNFIYEEFHPNHKIDIEEKVKDFMKHWFEKRFNEFSWELDDTLVLSDGKAINRENVVNKLNHVLESFTSFLHYEFNIADISFQWNEDEKKGLGHAEGDVQYDAVMENGDTLYIEGPFKLYMSKEGYCWSIFYFIFPGFEW